MSLSMTARLTVLATAISLGLGACGGGGGSEPKATPTSIVITPGPAASVQSGGTLQLSAQVLDQNGNAMSGQTVTWVSSVPAQATVSQTGLVSGSLVGSTAVTALLGSIVSNAVTVSVTAGSAATLTKSGNIPATMAAGTGDFLRVQVKDAAGNNVPGVVVNFAVSGAGSTLSQASATTDAAGIATVSLTVGTTAGQVTTVTVTSGALSAVTYTTNSVAGPPTQLRITSPRIDMVDSVGTVTVAVTLSDAFGNPLSSTGGVNYVSRNTSVATTNGSLITGIRRGQALIVAELAANPAVKDSMLIVVAVPTGSVLVTDLTRFDLKADTIFTVVVAMDMRSSGELLGSTRVQLAWDPAVLTYQSDAEGASSAGATVNAASAPTGTFTLAVANSSGFPGRVELRRVTFRANVTVGRSGSLALSTSELNGVSPNFTDVRPKTVAVSYPIKTR